MRYGTPPQGRRRNLEGSLRIPKAISCVEIDMDNRRDMEAPGPFDARYLAFLETIAQLRPRLHRYCSRMTGSVMDGEDVVQDALFEAYRKLDQYDDNRPLAPWLFRRPKARGRGESELKQSERRIRRSGLFTQELRLHH